MNEPMSHLRGKKVRIHINLHKSTKDNLVYSILHRGRVIEHATNFYIIYAKPIVQPAGLLKARATNQRNVHAFYEGYILTNCNSDEMLKPVSYHYNQGYFYTKPDYKQYDGSHLIWCSDKGLFINNKED